MGRTVQNPLRIARKQRGMTIIELMISITIGLFMVAAIGYLYVTSRGAYRSNSALARIQEDGRFGLDAISRDARQIGALGCSATAGVQALAGVTLQLPGDAGVARPYAGPDTALFGVQPTNYQFPQNGGGTTTFKVPASPTAPPWIAGDVLQMVIPTSEPVSLVADADPVNFTVTLANNGAKLQVGEFLLVSNCTNASIANVTAAPALNASPAVVGLTAQPLVPPSTVPQLTVATHAMAQRVDAVTYYVGQFPGRPFPALYRFSATNGVAEEIIDHVENMMVLYGVGNAAPVPAGQITAAQWPKVTSLRISLQVAGDEQSTAALNVPIALDYTNPIPAPDTRLRQIFTATVALRNRNP